jgi:hypothetical protein
MDYLEFWNRFCQAEQRADVFSIQTIGYQLYPMLRTRLYYQLAQELGIFDNPHPNAEGKSELEVVNLNHLVAGPAEVVIVPFARLVGSEDVYSRPFVDGFGSRARVLSHVELAEIRSYGKNKFDRFVYDAMLKEKKRDVRDRWSEMAKVFHEELGIGLGKFEEFPNWLVRKYIGECLAYKELFSQLGTKKLYIVNAYSHPSLVVGARQAGAKVVEIQHGFISEYHPAYHYPKIRIQSAPNVLLTWGEHWVKAANFPKGMRAKTVGPAQNYLLARAGFKEKSAENTILFSSQGAIGKALIAQAINWATELPEFEITFRLHPNEDLAEYQKLALPKNLTLSHKDPSFLDLMQSNRYLVGGFSTTIYEAVGFGLRAIALRLPGVENLNQAIADGDLAIADLDLSRKALLELLAKATPARNPYSYYAKDFNLKVALRA